MRYVGGKNGGGAFQRLINLMPPHDVYIEPFLGSGAVLRRKLPGLVNVGVDLDEAAVLAVAGELGRCGDAQGTPAPLVEVGVVGSGAACLALAGDRIPRFRLLVGDGLALLRGLRVGANVLVYCDPPYVLSSRRTGARYRFEFSDLQHRSLLRCLRRLGCHVMVSGYDCEMYRRELAGWSVYTFELMTRGGSFGHECVWGNFPWPVELHDYRWLGSTFREREKLKRRAARWRRRLGDMSLLERRALLDALRSL